MEKDFDYQKYLKEKTDNLSIESQFFVIQSFNAVAKALEEGNTEKVKFLFLDLLILIQQKEQMFKTLITTSKQELT